MWKYICRQLTSTIVWLETKQPTRSYNRKILHIKGIKTISSSMTNIDVTLFSVCGAKPMKWGLERHIVTQISLRYGDRILLYFWTKILSMTSECWGGEKGGDTTRRHDQKLFYMEHAKVTQLPHSFEILAGWYVKCCAKPT